MGRFESMMEDKFMSFKGDTWSRDYDDWLENNGIRKIRWSEGFREYFNIVNEDSRVCIKNPMARLYAMTNHLLLVPMDLMMKALVLGELP